MPPIKAVSRACLLASAQGAVSHSFSPCRCACCQFKVWVCVLRSWTDRHAKESKLEECAIVRWNLRLLKSMGLRHWEEITASVLAHFPQYDKKWFPVLGFIGFVTLLALLFILGCVSLLSKWNLITRYPVIFNFRVGTGRVLEKKFGTGRVPGSRRTLLGNHKGQRHFWPWDIGPQYSEYWLGAINQSYL